LDTRVGLVWAAIALTINGCGTLVDAPSPDRSLPVVEAVLIARTTSSTVHVTMVPPLDDPAQGPRAPVTARLFLSDEAGHRTELEPVADSAAYLRATLEIRPGGRYRLDGAIEGIPISAETTVPAGFEISLPAGDTIAAALRQVASIAFRWRAWGATAFAASPGVVGRHGGTHTRDTTGAIRIGPPEGDSPTSAPLLLWAMNADLEQYLFDDTAPTSNVHGGFGVLGGAIIARKTLLWR